MSDTISRAKAIEAINKALDRQTLLNRFVRKVAIDAIKQLPPAQPEHIKAKWLPIRIVDAVGGESAMWGDEIAYHACDNCWQQALEKDGEEVLSDFCPHCGAKMEVVT